MTNSSTQAPTKATRIDHNAEVGDAFITDQVEERAAEDPAEDADDHRAEAAVVLGAGGPPSQRTGEQADDDPSDDAHAP